MVDPEVRDEVPDEHVVPAKVGSEEVESSAGENEADVAQDNELGILCLVEGAAGVEMVDSTAEAVLLALAAALTLALMVVVASDIGEKVVGPANDLLGNEHGKGEGRGVLGELGELVDHAAETSGLLLASARDEDHVALHVAGCLVVLAVGDLPAEIGDQERGVEDPASHVVDEAGVGKGTVATLVGNDPEAGAKEALEDGVDGPEGASGEGAWDVLGGHKVVEDGEGGGEVDHVAGNVGVALESRALKAVLGDGITDVLDGVVGRRELVAVGVDELAVGGLGGVYVDRGERRQRGGRGRGSRGVDRRDGGGGFRRLIDGEVAAQSRVGDGAGGRGGGHGDNAVESGQVGMGERR